MPSKTLDHKRVKEFKTAGGFGGPAVKMFRVIDVPDWEKYVTLMANQFGISYEEVSTTVELSDWSEVK